jgi:subtilisin family serine protease
VLANLLACAPDVHAYGVKTGDNDALAFKVAMNIPDVKVISISMLSELTGGTTVSDCLPLQILILQAVLDVGITVVAAAGNGPVKTFPALMEQVIAVGGVSVDAGRNLSAYPDTSSFAFAGRNVPDLCGLASNMRLPTCPVPKWGIDDGTSFAAPQVAGVVALLLQKKETLTPDLVRDAMKNTATDIDTGTTAFGLMAAPGPDLATGHGLVNALEAWHSV